MAHVIGLPLHRGNSEIYTTAKLDGDASSYFEGQVVGLISDGVVGLPAAGKCYGFICDINKVSGYATVVRAADGVMLPVEGAITVGAPVAIDLTTKKVCASAAGKIATNATFVGPVAMAYDGKTGALVSCAKVAFGLFEDQGAVAATMAASAQSKTSKE